MRKQLFAQVWELVRNQPLLTCISVLGTAFAITMIMVIVIVWQTKYADLAPEVNRSRCLYISAVGVQQKDNKSYGGYSSCSPAFMKRCVEGVPGVEACTAFSPATDALISLSDGGNRIKADVSHVDPAYWQVFRFDFLSGAGLTEADWGGSRQSVVLCASVARHLFGTTDAVGKKIYEDDKPCEVAGVFRDYKHRDYEQPYPLIVRTFDNMWGGSYMQWLFSIVIRVKPGVDASAFEQRFRNEVGPRLAMGNFYFDKLQEFSEVSKAYAMRSGVSNKLRLQYALTGFAMLCIFLGMVGTFWIRSNARRGEIGVMRSMGASQGCIVRQFLIEAWLLLTVAFVLVIPFLLYHAYTNGLYTLEMYDEFVPNPAYGQNRFGFHFTVVLAISYVLLLIVALVGTYIPVRRAARTLPVEALREE